MRGRELLNIYKSCLVRWRRKSTSIYIKLYICVISDIFSPISPSLGGTADRLELLDPTHRGLHRLDQQISQEVHPDERRTYM
jgi:hypothetical protein